MVVLFGQLAALDAGVALEEGVVAVSLDRNDPAPVFDVDEDGAGGVTDAAEGLQGLRDCLFGHVCLHRVKLISV